MNGLVSLVEHMHAISEISVTTKENADALHHKSDFDCGNSSPDLALDTCLCKAEKLSHPLDEYLQQLDVIELKKLVTLMYAGREINAFKEDLSLSAFHNDLKKTPVHDQEKSGYIRILMEKINALSYYYNSIIKECAVNKIDIDQAMTGIM